MQQVEPLCRQLTAEKVDPRQVAARPGEAGDNPDGRLALDRKKLAAFSALGGGFLHDFSLFFVAQRRNGDARER